jgi:hypothetical protein
MQKENEYYANIINKTIVNELKPGQSVLVLSLFDVSFLPGSGVRRLAKNRASYENYPLLFIVFSYLKNQTEYELGKTLTYTGRWRKGSWILVRFTKLN